MIWRRSRRRPYGVVAASALVVAFAPFPAAEARSYLVLSCDAVPGSASSSEAWFPSTSVSGSSYAVCPSQGSLNAGISDRITSATVPGLAYSGHTLTAPPGSWITGVRWGGRFARGDCHWGAFLRALPSTTMIVGLAQNSQCASTGLDIRGTPLSFAVPQGTTALQQVIVCGAPSCGPGATFHTTASAVTIEDPTAPLVAADGGLVAGRWVRGDQQITVSARDNSGIAKTWATIGSDSVPTAWPCRYTSPRPCADQVGPIVLPTGRVASGLQQVLVGAQDAAGNVTYAEYTARVDNEPPERVRPVVAGGDAWRRSDGFAVGWQTPPQANAPITRAWYKLCGPQACSVGSVDGPGVDAVKGLTAGESGDFTLQVWLEDEAGNQSYALSASDAVHLRLDQEPPRPAFEPQDPGDPLRVAVQVDDLHSGLDTGAIEMRRRGGDAWQSLPTAAGGSAPGQLRG